MSWRRAAPTLSSVRRLTTATRLSTTASAVSMWVAPAVSAKYSPGRWNASICRRPSRSSLKVRTAPRLHAVEIFRGFAFAVNLFVAIVGDLFGGHAAEAAGAPDRLVVRQRARRNRIGEAFRSSWRDVEHVRTPKFCRGFVTLRDVVKNCGRTLTSFRLGSVTEAAAARVARVFNHAHEPGEGSHRRRAERRSRVPRRRHRSPKRCSECRSSAGSARECPRARKRRASSSPSKPRGLVIEHEAVGAAQAPQRPATPRRSL